MIRFFLSIAEMGELMSRRLSFFDTDDRLRSLSEAGDPLERLSTVIDFELFRPELEAVLARRDRGKGGRPPYDAVLMFKVLVVQTLYTLSDDQTEYQIKDRLSFMRFVGLELCDPVPDAKTIWLYRETLARADRAPGGPGDRGADVRLQEPCRYRPRIWLRQTLRRDPCRRP